RRGLNDSSARYPNRAAIRFAMSWKGVRSGSKRVFSNRTPAGGPSSSALIGPRRRPRVRAPNRDDGAAAHALAWREGRRGFGERANGTNDRPETSVLDSPREVRQASPGGLDDEEDRLAVGRLSWRRFGDGDQSPTGAQDAARS